MTSILELKKNRAASLERLAGAADKVNNTGERSADDRYWQPVVDKTGTGYAVIRFLDSPVNEDVPFVKLWNHGFQGPGGWYIENSRTTLGEPDPLSEYNSELWQESSDDESPQRKQVRKQKRKLNFISNILVVKHPGRPEDEGKVFLYKYGKKIFDKLNKKMNPEIPDVPRFNPFDFWDGANFRLVISKDGQYRSYNDSEFAACGPVSEDDQEIDRIWKSCYSLQEEIAPGHFKSYDELKARLTLVLKPKARKDEEDTAAAMEAQASATAPTARTNRPAAQETVQSSESGSADTGDDDDLSYFRTLLKKQ